MSDSMNGRLATYAAAVGAAGVAGAANGLEVWLDQLGIELGQFSAQPLDFLLDDEPDLLLKNYVFPRGNYQGAVAIFEPASMVGFVSNGLAYVSVLNAGDPINDQTVLQPDDTRIIQASMAYGSQNPNAQWNDVTDGYLGLRFPHNEGTETFYGWVRLSINNNEGTVLIDSAFASDDPNGIVAGQVGTAGDYNGNGSVEQGDLDLVLGNWGTDTRSVEEGGQGIPEGWLNQFPGESVDQAELDLVLSQWGSSSSPNLRGVAVPEPGMLGCLAAGALGLRRWRGGRAGG